MAKSPIRKTLEHLIKKVEALEDQSFAQKLLIDDLENRLSRAEQTIKQVQENPFGIPYQPYPYNPQPAPMPLVSPAPPQYTYHHCVGGTPDVAGNSFCVQCGALMYGISWTVLSTPHVTSTSTDTEPVLDLDISWVIPDDLNTKD
jgi:hypothetical protein